MSSRNRRSQGDRNDNPFFTDETEAPTFESVDRKGYGGPLLGKLDKHITAKPIPISEIAPDPTQPRRTIPFVVRENWDGQLDSLFDGWITAVDQERGDDSFEIDRLLTAQGDGVRNPTPKPIEESLLKVIDLAVSIKRDGLTNPITVVSNPNGAYTLETGERRWLAYHLLYEKFDDDQWAKVPARVVDQFSVWRQASENNARDDLNAIGKARQFALLLMALYEDEGNAFEPFEKLVQVQGSDRMFYAQVADGEQWRIPRGKGDLLLNAMNLKSIRQLSQYRALLTLPDEGWMIADDSNLTEYRLRQILDMKLDVQSTINLIIDAAQEFGEESGTVVPVVKSHRKAARVSLFDRMTLQSKRIHKHFEQELKKAQKENQEQLRRFAKEQAEWWSKFS